MPATLAALAACAAPIGWQTRGNPRLADYQRAFEREAGTAIAGHASRAEALQLIRGCRVLWLGDHHRDQALHHRQLDLLQQLVRDGAHLCLGLEAIGTQDQAAVDAYLAGSTDLDHLIAAVRRRWPASWLGGGDVDAAHYRALLRFARATGSPVFALEPTPRLPLAQRDRTIAASVRLADALHPDRLLVVVLGQTHLLGHGRVPERTGLSSFLLGAEPPPVLAAELDARRRAGTLAPDDLVRTDGGLWY
ncbi:MAG: ChaN family lipoprotein [Planctomycetota bacterium]